MTLTTRIAFYWETCLLLCGLSHQALADIHKCVAADGSTSYTDTPCATNLKENGIDSSVSSLGHQTVVSDTCYKLNVRKNHCGSMYSLLETNFRQYCTNPLSQYQVDHQRNQQYNRYRTAKERATESADATQAQFAEDYRCEALPKDTWAFLKENFSKKISAHDSKELDYNLNGVPNSGRATSYSSTTTDSRPQTTVTITNTTVVRAVVNN
jgi:hypothetical protein